MKMNIFQNKRWKSIITTVIVCALVIASVAGLATLFNRDKDTKTISPSVFSVGALDENGKYLESEVSIFTEDVIECQGLVIEPDFMAEGSFQVFYYDEDKAFIDSTDVMEAKDGLYKKGDTFPTAKYCRIVITPAVPVDEDGNKVEDFKIRFYEVRGYAKDYTITVSKNQGTKLVSLHKETGLVDYGIKPYDVEGIYGVSGMDGYTISYIIDVSEYSSVTVYCDKDAKIDYFYSSGVSEIGPAIPNFPITTGELFYGDSWFCGTGTIIGQTETEIEVVKGSTSQTSMNYLVFSYPVGTEFTVVGNK